MTALASVSFTLSREHLKQRSRSFLLLTFIFADSTDFDKYSRRSSSHALSRTFFSIFSFFEMLRFFHELVALSLSLFNDRRVRFVRNRRDYDNAREVQIESVESVCNLGGVACACIVASVLPSHHYFKP